MHMWNENEAGRGSSEVCSALKKTLLARKRSEYPTLFSDGCCGQNKNKTMLFFLQSLIEQGIYKSISGAPPKIYYTPRHQGSQAERFEMLEPKRNPTTICL
ncbi:hypothetical protein PoB_007245500 [Plakobranchus ocellatus]|uniref:Uncharacterized protein n=1 Tax=Plakobranchus ocellatus TaxID=259542 RepID=A0AAV4DPS0_9GAST|nr:hypothetical protein PoB_005113400 [Plakobranchus ocellatus]GFO45950.1 hypothetical protein PoB_007245500 [Plakobranchus ocellatus]